METFAHFATFIRHQRFGTLAGIALRCGEALQFELLAVRTIYPFELYL